MCIRDRIKTHNDQYFAENAHIKKLFEETKKENETLLDQTKELKFQLAEYRTAFETSNAEIEVLRTQLEETCSENEQLKELIASIKHELEEVSEAYRKLQNKHCLLYTSPSPRD
eukprot:TRINITY_DN899_c0_g1_i24.p1 TRINITY_DN899_c0_g1~~TRINITY_DN899_c0_g1_i24.p1  ORF type:complete len:114 (-),score=18.76 TRINITY_DN899_c0_g1_i24:53-394(-)